MTSTLTIDDRIAPVANPTARCADGNGTLTPLFFSDVNVDIARAKAICRRCSLADACLSGALEREEPWGVWGGELIESGRIVVDRRPRGRPSVLPKPIIVIDEDRTLRTITDVSEQRPFEVAVRVA
ncbi:MAG: WhiB family transcriptional regulator [Actinomycetota bacterium]|jgi:WhiB family redox-sensing transcriptional regulator